jgi:hypothetical protein
MRHSFAPFGAEELAFLSQATAIDLTTSDPREWLCVSARDERGRLMGACFFEFKSWCDAHFTCAIADRRCLTRRLLRAMFTAVFSRAARVSAFIEPWNATAINQAHQMGFELEGYCRLAVEGRRDALLLGMTRDTCRFLRRAPRRPQAAVEGKYGQHSEV